MLTLSIGSSVAWGTFRLFKNLACYNGEANRWRTAEVIAQMSDGLVQTFSFVVLCYGVVKIRNYIIKSGLRNQINTRMICLQSIAFGSYLVASSILYIEIIIFSKSRTMNVTIMVLIVYILANFLAFVTQVLLAMIFIQIGKKGKQANI